MTELSSNPTVLVIDDELGPRESLRYLLKNEYNVVCADNVDRGIELLREHSPDAVIMDIRMPGRNGIEGLREIRRIDSDVAVIMLTGFAALGTAQEAVRHEASDYLEKPFDTTEMRRTVERHTARTRMRRKREQLAREVEQLQDRLSREVDQKSNWAELGQASAEFVHDLRNMLTAACGTADLLRHDLQEQGVSAAPAPEDLNTSLDLMERTMRQSTELLDAWQRLIRHEPDRQAVFHLPLFLRDVVANSQSEAQAAQVRLVCEVPGGDLLIQGDPVQLARAVGNLIHNSIQAVPRAGGRVAVSLSREGNRAVVRVDDNGCGISAENLPKIFSSDFSTKRMRGGMGLGLFIARKIVQMFGGELTAESAPGQGTTMTISLPVVSEKEDSILHR
jgi:signal transduction histidine kinase